MAESRGHPGARRPPAFGNAKRTREAAPQRPAGRISPARRAAFDILERLAVSQSHSDDLLHGPALRPLEQADRNLTTALVLGVLRWQIALDARVRALLQRPDQPLASPVQTALRLGAFQLLHMDRIPAHAALSESVELVKATGNLPATGLVNAVLRKLASSSSAGEQARGRPIYESVPAAAERLGHPVWLVERWVRQYGRAAAVEICAANQVEPTTGTLFLPEGIANALPSEAVAGDAGAEPAWPRLDDGSRLIAELAAASQPKARRVWDACAAPGGKTMVLARRLPEAQVLASDISSTRLHLMERRLQTELPGGKVETLLADATASDLSQSEFDLILCDVPCSGTGTLSRNPEIRHRLQAGDLVRQAERQARILSAALGKLAPGGRLLYSTCSLESEENEAVVEALLAAQPAKVRAVESLSLTDPLQHLLTSGVLREVAALDVILRGPYLRTLPGSGFQGDGFFAALFARKD